MSRVLSWELEREMELLANRGVYYLETPCCGAPVFERNVNYFEDGEAERCPDCGDMAFVHSDIEEPNVWVAMADEPPDNWPTPWPAASCEVRT